MAPEMCWTRSCGVSNDCLWVDGSYTGLLNRIAEAYSVTLEVVSKRPDLHTVVVLPRRWMLERTFAWLEQSRILSNEYTRCESASLSWIYISSIQTWPGCAVYASAGI